MHMLRMFSQCFPFQVNANGDISFIDGYDDYNDDPFPMAYMPLIAPYLTDLFPGRSDRRATSAIYYRQDTTTTTLAVCSIIITSIISWYLHLTDYSIVLSVCITSFGWNDMISMYHVRCYIWRQLNMVIIHDILGA